MGADGPALAAWLGALLALQHRKPALAGLLLGLLLALRPSYFVLALLPLWLGIEHKGERRKFLLSIALVGLISLLFVWQADGWAYLLKPHALLGIILFFAGMFVNLHSDYVIRHLRRPGDTKHYLPGKGLYRYVTSANYFGELVEWTGFAILTASPAAWVFVWWTFANLVPRADAIHRRYREEFGDEAVGKRKRIIPFLY